MKRLFCAIAVLAAAVAASAQNTQDAAAAAAAALNAAEDVPVKVEKPKYWTNTLLTNISFGQTWLTQWAGGGYNNVSLAGNIDANFNYQRDKLKGFNRIQLDYGFLWSADKPILQKNKDRIYLESKWGYESFIKNLSYSGSFDFKTEFDRIYDYKTPATYLDDDGNVIEPTTQDWLDARVLKSGLLAPAYLNVGIGGLWTPAPWISLNVAPLSGGGVFVTIPELRYTYGMDLRKDSAYTDRKSAYTEGAYDEFRAARLEFGAQIKLDMGWVINDKFSYTTQFTAFYDYLTPKVEPRFTWDNKVYWKLAKFFALTLSTNMIYDPKVTLKRTDGTEGKGVQLKEFLEFGFTYSISRQR